MSQLTTLLFELLLLAVLIGLNGLFAMAEAAVLSSRETRLHTLAEQGKPGAQAALDLLENPNRFLSTVQIGITLVGVLAGAASGATIARIIAEPLRGLPLIGPYVEPLALGLSVAVITYLTLVFGELLPKRIALNNPEAVASRVARPMQQLARVARPAVRLLTFSTQAAFRVLGVRPEHGPPVTEDDIRQLIEQGAQTGVLDSSERAMAEQIFLLDDIRTSLLMTPRPEIDWLDANDPPDALAGHIADGGHTSYPVCDNDLDRVLGVLDVRAWWAAHREGAPPGVTGYLTPPVYIPENALALDALKTIKQNGARMALVIDEFGGIAGLLTPNDLLEAIVGDIPEAGEPPTPDAQKRSDGSWLVDAQLPARELAERLGRRTLPGRMAAEVDTVGGYVMAVLGRIPAAADSFETGGLRFEVVDMDGYRVDKVLVSVSEADADAGGGSAGG